jgi:hypothetical protein
MRYAVAFALLSASCVLLAVVLPWPLVPLDVWIGTSFAIVSVAYAGVGPHVLGKTADGALPWWSLALNGPFLLLGLASMRVVKLVLREEPWTQVAPGIYLGRRPSAHETAAFRALNIGTIVDLCAELPATRARTGQEAYCSVPVLDGQAPSDVDLARAIAFIDAQRALGPVFVHCALGRSRSATVVAAWRLAHGLDRDAEQVERTLRRSRPVVDLRTGQREALDKFSGTRPPLPVHESED